MKSVIKWCLAGFQILHSPQAPFLLLSACSEPHSTRALLLSLQKQKTTQKILTAPKFSSQTTHTMNIQAVASNKPQGSLVSIPELWNSGQWGNKEQTGPKIHGNKMDIPIQTYLSAAWSHKLLCHHHWGHTIGTMARRNFYHTTSFWNNNKNKNKFFARTAKEFLGNF